MVGVDNHVAGRTPARTVTRHHQKPGNTVRDTAQEKVEPLRAGAADRAREGRGTAQPLEGRIGQYVREQPLTSILIAAGVGLVLGRFWMRR